MSSWPGHSRSRCHGANAFFALRLPRCWAFQTYHTTSMRRKTWRDFGHPHCVELGARTRAITLFSLLSSALAACFWSLDPRQQWSSSRTTGRNRSDDVSSERAAFAATSGRTDSTVLGSLVGPILQDGIESPHVLEYYVGHAQPKQSPVA